VAAPGESETEGMTHILINPPNHLLRIDAVWLAVSVDEDGNEGACATTVMLAGGPMMVPLIAADEGRLAWVKAEARKIALASGQRVRVIRLTTREEIETYEGKGGNA